MKSKVKNYISVDPRNLVALYPPPREDSPIDEVKFVISPAYDSDSKTTYYTTETKPILGDPRRIDLTKKNYADFEVTGRKTDGEQPGLMLALKHDDKDPDQPKIGMIKFAKYLFVTVKDITSFLKKAAPADHVVVLDEFIGLQIASRLGIPTSDAEFALTKTSIDQLKSTGETSGLAEFEDGIFSSAAQEYPTLKINFSKTSKLLESKVVAGSDKEMNQGHLRPICEGINSNQVLGKDFATFNIFTFLTNDPDTMGKNYQNKLLVGSKLFVIDSAMCPMTDNNIRIGIDGHFYSKTYKNRNNPNGSNRHTSFRNLSITDDTSFMEMLEAVIDFFKKGKDKELLADLDADYKKFREIKFPQQDKFLARIEDHKKTLSGRIEKLKNTFSPYVKVYKDKDLVTSIVALEELLSESSAYSEEGIPLRTPQIPFDKHFFCHGKISLSKEDKQLVLNFAGEDFKSILNKIIPILPLTMKITVREPCITFDIDDFKKCFTSNRVILLTHPETVPLKTTLSELDNINYLENFDKLISSLPFRDLASSLEVFYSTYLTFEEKSPGKAFDALETMVLAINQQLPENLLDTRKIDHTKGWGKLVELKSKIVKQQQFLLCNYLDKNPDFEKILAGKSILDLFANADLLDISHSLNRLLRVMCANPKMLTNDSFNKIINSILTIKAPINNYIEFRALASNLHEDINTLLSTPKLQDSLGVIPPTGLTLAESKESTQTTQPDKSELGTISAQTKAPQDLSNSISALTTGNQNIFPVTGSTSDITPSISQAQTSTYT